MGTNYYAIPKINEKSKQLMIQAIQEEKFGIAKSMMPDSVHIGKSSWGWAFLFNHNHWSYYKDVSEMWKWLENCEIEDEYGTAISLDDFKQMVANKQEKKGKETNPDWYEFHDEYVFSTSTDFS